MNTQFEKNNSQNFTIYGAGFVLKFINFGYIWRQIDPREGTYSGLNLQWITDYNLEMTSAVKSCWLKRFYGALYALNSKILKLSNEYDVK